MAKDGYNFLGFTTGTGAAFDFNTEITKATTIYAYYDKVTVYHTLANADDNLIAEDFNNKTATDAYTKLVSYGTKGLYCGGAGDASQVAFENRKAVVKNDGTNAGKLVVDFGEDISNSVLKITFELLMEGGDNYTFFQISTPDSTDPAFGLGLAGNTSGRKLRYKDPAGTDVTTTTDFTPDATHLFELTIDLAAKKVSVKMDGAQIAELNETSFTSLPDEVQGMSFQTKTNKCNLELNNIAVNKGAATLEAVKAGAKAALQSAYDEIVETDYIDATTDPDFDTQWAPVLAAKTAGDTAIDAAENATAALAARDTAITAVGTALDTLREDLVDSLTDSTNGGIAAWTWSRDTTAQTNYNAGTPTEKAAYDEALTELKAQYIVEGKVMFKKNATDTEFTEVSNIKEGYAAFAQFETAAKNIVKEKVAITIKYFKYVYTEATGITEWATNTEYFTLANNVYTKVDTTAVTAPASGTKYYTRSIESAGADATYKIVKDSSAVETDVPTLSNFFTVGYYQNEALTTPFDFSTSIEDNTVKIYTLVTVTSYWDKTFIPLSGEGAYANDSDARPLVLCEMCKFEKVSGNPKVKVNTSGTPAGVSLGKGSASLTITVAAGNTVEFIIGLGSSGSSKTTDKSYLYSVATDETKTVVKTGTISADNATSSIDSTTGEMTIYGSTGETYLTITLTEGKYMLMSDTASSNELRVHFVSATLK